MLNIPFTLNPKCRWHAYPEGLTPKITNPEPVREYMRKHTNAYAGPAVQPDRWPGGKMRPQAQNRKAPKRGV